MTETAQTLSHPLRRGTARSPGIIEIARRLRANGWLEFLMDLWRTQGDLPHLRTGLGNVMLVIHPEHVRHISITARQSFDKLNKQQQETLTAAGLMKISPAFIWPVLASHCAVKQPRMRTTLSTHALPSDGNRGSG